MELPNPFNGKYVLKRHIGHGAMKDVWEAEDTIQKRDVALKVQTEEYLQESVQAQLYPPDVVAVSKNEAVALTKIGSHPNIAEIYDANIDTTTKRFYIAEELVLGKNLAERLKDINASSRRGANLVRHYAHDISRGLAHIHRKGIVHGDLRLENIVIDEHDRAKITDFGLAALSGETPYVLGSVLYRAPEVIAGLKPTPASDMWQLGVMLYYAATGSYPWPVNVSDWATKTLAEKKRFRDELKIAILKQPIISPRKKNPRISTYLSDVINSCLNQNPEKRMSARQAALRLGMFGWWKELAIASALSTAMIPALWFGMQQYAQTRLEHQDIIFTAAEQGPSKVYRVDTSFLPHEQLSDKRCFGLAVNPAGNFSYIRVDKDLQRIIFRTPAGERPIYEADRIMQQAWSPDGTKLAAFVEKDKDHSFIVLDRDGKELAKERGICEKELQWHPSGAYLTALADNALYVFLPGKSSRRATEYPRKILAHAWTSKGLMTVEPDAEHPTGFVKLHWGDQAGYERHALKEPRTLAAGMVTQLGEFRDKSGFWYLTNRQLHLEQWEQDVSTEGKTIDLSNLEVNSGKGILAAVEGKTPLEWYLIGRREDIDGSKFIDDGDNQIWRATLESSERVQFKRYSGLRAVRELLYLPRQR